MEDGVARRDIPVLKVQSGPFGRQLQIFQLMCCVIQLISVSKDLRTACMLMVVILNNYIQFWFILHPCSSCYSDIKISLTILSQLTHNFGTVFMIRLCTYCVKYVNLQNWLYFILQLCISVALWCAILIELNVSTRRIYWLLVQCI